MEQSLIDLNSDSSPVQVEDMVPDPLQLLQLHPTVSGSGCPMETHHSDFRTLGQQSENQPSKRVCLIKPGVRKVINSIECGGHQIMSEMKSCTENTIIPLEMYHKYLRSKGSTMDIRRTKGSVEMYPSKLVDIRGMLTKIYGTFQVELKIDGMEITTMAYVTTDRHHQNAVYAGRNEMYLRGIGYGADGIADLKSAGTMLLEGCMPGGPQHKLRGMLDTGAVCNVMGLAAWKRIRGDATLTESPIHLLMLDGSSMTVIGMTPPVAMNIGGHEL